MLLYIFYYYLLKNFNILKFLKLKIENLFNRIYALIINLKMQKTYFN